MTSPISNAHTFTTHTLAFWLYVAVCLFTLIANFARSEDSLDRPSLALTTYNFAFACVTFYLVTVAICLL